VSVSGLDVTCFLLDYGAYETVNFSQMRYLNSELATIKVSTVNLAITGKIPEDKTVFVKSITTEHGIPTHHVTVPKVERELVGNPAPILPSISHYPNLSDVFTQIEAYFHTNSDGFTMSKNGHDFYKGKLDKLKNAPTIDVNKQYVEKNSVVGISAPDGFFRIKVTEVTPNSTMIKFMYLDCPEWPTPDVHEISLSQVYVLPEEYSLQNMPNDNVFIEVTPDFENKVSEEQRMLFWEKKRKARCRIQGDTVVADFFDVKTVSHAVIGKRNYEKGVILSPKYLCLGLDNYESINKIEEDIEKSELMSKKFIRLFEPCILKSEEKFLRAVCTKKEAEKLTFYCYDHGDRRKASINDVFEMPDEFLEREVFVVCHDSEGYSEGEVVNIDQIQKVSENKDHSNYPCRVKAIISKVKKEVEPTDENIDSKLFTVGQLECPFKNECIWLINSEKAQKFNDWWIAIYENGQFDPSKLERVLDPETIDDTQVYLMKDPSEECFGFTRIKPLQYKNESEDSPLVCHQIDWGQTTDVDVKDIYHLPIDIDLSEAALPGSSFAAFVQGMVFPVDRFMPEIVQALEEDFNFKVVETEELYDEFYKIVEAPELVAFFQKYC